jgi:hypothetical protein
MTQGSKEKSTTIFVNTRETEVVGEEITFQQVVDLAFPGEPSGPLIVYTVTFRRGHGQKADGSLTEGASVKLKEGMIFNVTRTDKS